ncbi:unnamed protein product, partial [Chrysoparadoxa australica]
EQTTNQPLECSAYFFSNVNTFMSLGGPKAFAKRLRLANRLAPAPVARELVEVLHQLTELLKDQYCQDIAEAVEASLEQHFTHVTPEHLKMSERAPLFDAVSILRNIWTSLRHEAVGAQCASLCYKLSLKYLLCDSLQLRVYGLTELQKYITQVVER